MRTLLKKWLGRALGKSGPPVVAVFLSGEEALSRAMALQMRELVPDHPHIIVGPAPLRRDSYAYSEDIIEIDPHRPLAGWLRLRRRLGSRWIALAPFVWEDGARLRWMPWLLAPSKLLAFNSRLERHHLRLTSPIASWRFLRGQSVGDIFRPTPLAPLKKALAFAGFPLLMACWAAVRLRRRRAAPLSAPPASENGITLLASDAALDQSVAEARSGRILVGREDLAPQLAPCLDDPRVWMAYAGEKLEGEAKLGEQGTWSILGHAAAVMFRRDVYLALGGGDLRALSLLGWQRGHRTVFAAPAEVAPHEAVSLERLILMAAADLRTAAQFLRKWSWRPSRWKAVLSALDVKPLSAPPGSPRRDFVPLLEPVLHVFRGRPQAHRRRVAVVSPYLPFPLSHGGAIRIFNLLRAAAREADIYLFAFAEKETGREVGPLLELCSRVVLVQGPRWEPAPLLRVLPRGVGKFRSKAMQAAISTVVRDEQIRITQIEYTQLAHLRAPAKTLLVEHDVTFDLHRQLRRRARGWGKVSAALEEWRWRRYELSHARRFDGVIAMSQEDRDRLLRAGLDPERVSVIENGVDLDRFRPAPPSAGNELLFIGSFRHFPNIEAFRFLLHGVWPALREWRPAARLTVVAGADHRYYWRLHTGSDLPALPPQIELLDFVEDVRPLYRRATVVVAPLVVSAGTNIKVLEALAMGRALVSTTVGAQGLGLTSGDNVIVADSPDAFATAVLGLLSNDRTREEIAARGRAFVEARYAWVSLAKKLLTLWEELSP